MRKLIFVLVASVSLLGLASVASASSVELRWTGTTGSGALGGSDINVSNTAAETLTLTLILNADGAGVGIFGMSLIFDSDLANELNVASYAEGSWANGKGARTMANINLGIETTQESQSGGPQGRLFTFEAFSIGTGIKNSSMIWGTVVFTTNPANVATDGADIFSGVFNTFVDDNFDNGGNLINNDLVGPTASVNTVMVPEPGIVALLGVGVGALLLAGRRRK